MRTVSIYFLAGVIHVLACVVAFAAVIVLASQRAIERLYAGLR
jgi:hypothetical protein